MKDKELREELKELGIIERTDDPSDRVYQRVDLYSDISNSRMETRALGQKFDILLNHLGIVIEHDDAYDYNPYKLTTRVKK